MSLPCLSLQVGKNYVLMFIIYYFSNCYLSVIYSQQDSVQAPSSCAYIFCSQTMPEPRLNLNLLLLLVLSVPGKISVQIPSSLCMHLLSARNNHGNNEWALGAGCFVFRSWMLLFFVLRLRCLRLTCRFCSQNMKVQIILNCI